MNSLLIGPGLPGGMMGSLMADLESNRAVHKEEYKAKPTRPSWKQDELLIKLCDERHMYWPRVGYPPFARRSASTSKAMPTATMNDIAMEKGKERWGTIADDIWDMLLGKAGKLLVSWLPKS